MIRSFRHKGLKRFYEKGSARGLPPQRLSRLRLILAGLDAAEDLDGLSLPGYQLHPLKGELKGFWSLRVTGNFRVIFRFEKKEPWDVDWSTTTRWRENDADA